jgi:hypothetical protein
MFTCSFAKRKLFSFLAVTAILYLIIGMLHVLKVSLPPEPGIPLLLAFILYLVLIPGILFSAISK